MRLRRSRLAVGIVSALIGASSLVVLPAVPAAAAPDGAPTNVTAAAGYTLVRVSWDPPADGTTPYRYEVTLGDGAATTIRSTTLRTEEFAVAPDQTYNVLVTPFLRTDLGDGGFIETQAPSSDPLTVTTLALASAPTDVVVEPRPGGARITYVAPPDLPAGAAMAIGLERPGSSNLDFLSVFEPGPVEVSWPDMDPSQTYSIRLTAFASPGCCADRATELSSPVPFSPLPALVPVASFTTEPIQAGIRLTWTPPVDPARVSFTAYALDPVTGDFAVQATVDREAGTADLAGLEPGVAYVVGVVADSAFGFFFSGLSEQIEATAGAIQTAPETVLTDGPPALTNAVSPTFTFTSPNADTTFLCTVDGGVAVPCVSPYTVSGLADGPHTFTAAAVDPAGNADPTPSTMTFRRDTVPPVIAITRPTGAESYAVGQVVAPTYGCSDVNLRSCDGPSTLATSVPGPQTLTITASDDAGNTSSASVPYLVVEGQLPQTITFAALPTQRMPIFRFWIRPTASSGLAVTVGSTTPEVCTVTPQFDLWLVELVSAGRCTLVASQAGDAVYLPAPDVVQSFDAVREATTISFPPVGTRTLVESPWPFLASVSSGFRPEIVSLTPAVCASGPIDRASNLPTVIILAVGICTLTASFAGNAFYSPAPPITQSFEIIQAHQIITMSSPGTQTLLQSPTMVTTSSSSGLAVSVTSSTPAVCTAGAVDPTTRTADITLLAPGICTLVASQPGDTNYRAAPSVTRSFRVTKAAQTIVFLGSSARTIVQSPFEVTATSSSGLPVTVASSTPTVCTVAALDPAAGTSTVTLLTTGTCTLLASQAGDATYHQTAVSRSFTVNRANQTITFAGITTKTIPQSPFTVTATASSGLPVTLASTTPEICTVTALDPAAGTSTVTLLATGTCSLLASQAGDATYNPAPNVTRSFTVNRANQTITFAGITTKTIPQSPFTVTATASSGLPVTLASTTPTICTVGAVDPVTAAAVVTLVAPGTCRLTATQPGDNGYNAAPRVTRSFAVRR